MLGIVHFEKKQGSGCHNNYSRVKVLWVAFILFFTGEERAIKVDHSGLPVVQVVPIPQVEAADDLHRFLFFNDDFLNEFGDVLNDFVELVRNFPIAFEDFLENIPPIGRWLHAEVGSAQNLRLLERELIVQEDVKDKFMYVFGDQFGVNNRPLKFELNW